MRLWYAVGCAALSMAAIGCTNHAEIAVYEVPKEAKATAVPRRMLAAMVPHAGQTWFFKLSGPESQVTPEIETFVKLVRSVTFPSQGEQPKWETPEGWSDSPGTDGVRYATISRSTGDGKLEITVTVLPTGPDWDDYVLQNVNRWRGQLGLPPASADELDQLLIKMPLESDPSVEAVMVNIEGAGSGGMAPPTAAAGPPAGPVRPQTPPTSNADPAELAFDLPAGWQATQNNAFSRYAFIVEGDDAAARVTLTPLAATGGPGYILANVNRWRNQVGLEPLSPEQADAELQDIPFLGGVGKLVLALPEEAAGRNGIIGVIGIHGSTAWFVKMSGDAEFLQSKRSEFEQFVRSIHISGEGSS